MGTGTGEDWLRLLGVLASLVVEVSGVADRRAARGVVVCSLCGGAAPPLLAVSPGYLCRNCLAIASLALYKDWRAVRVVNDRYQAFLSDLAGSGNTINDLAEHVRTITAELRTKTAENDALKEEANRAASEILLGKHACNELRAQVATLELELETLRRELAARAEQAASAAADLRAVPWMIEFKSFLHPKIFSHVLDLVARSASSAMVKTIEGFIQGMLRAATTGMTTMEGTGQELIVKLEKAGLLRPDGYSGRVLSWLERRTPLVSRKVSTPVVYLVRLDWCTKPGQECLDDHRLARR